MLILNFLHAAAGVPLLNVCGVPLVCRSSLTARNNGFEAILLLVHAADLVGVARLLTNEKRLGLARVVATAEGAARELQRQADHGRLEICIAPGNRIWTGDMPGIPPAAEVFTPGVIRHDGEKRGGLRKILSTDPHQLAAALFEDRADDPGFPPPGAFAQAEQSPRPAWCDINGVADVPAAEHLLLSQLAKSSDGIISRHLNRRISLAITRRIMHTSITPNQVTALVLLIGILSGPVIVSIGGYPGLVLGSLLYYLAAILDGCDGELSRLKFQGSASGAWLDTVVDDTVGLSYLLGLYIQLYAQQNLWGPVGLAALFFYLATLLPRYYVMAAFLGSGDYQKLAAAKSRKTGTTLLVRTISLLEDTVCRTDFIPFAAFVTAAIGCPQIFAGAFLIGVIGSAIDSLVTLLAMRKKRVSA